MGAAEVDHPRHDRVGGRRVLDERAAVSEAARTLNRLLALIGRGGVANVGLGQGNVVLAHELGTARRAGRAAAGGAEGDQAGEKSEGQSMGWRSVRGHLVISRRTALQRARQAHRAEEARTTPP
jgi:hypothetical protein